MRKGKFTTRTRCRFCSSKRLVKILDMGLMPLSGDYLLRKDIGKEYYYPLRIYFCKKCFLVQILDVISPDILFKDYRYLSSVSLKMHFKNYANEMTNKFLRKGDFVVEIGSNDGVLLLPLKKLGIKVLGIDPARNIANIAKKKGVDTIVDYFSEEKAKYILARRGLANAIFANNVLAHIDNMKNVFRGIKLLLNPKGVLVFEVHYFPELVKGQQYDFFYNEHLCYYTTSTLLPFLKSYDLEIVDIKKLNLHAGSVRVYVKSKGNKNYKNKISVKKILTEERNESVINEKVLKEFSKNIYKHRYELRKFILSLKKKRIKIVGYGASGRGNTLLNFCGINEKIIDYIVDESPERQGRFTPGTHIPIVKPDFFRKDTVMYALLLAWNYEQSIIKKEKDFINKGGRFIIPLPIIRLAPE